MPVSLRQSDVIC